MQNIIMDEKELLAKIGLSENECEVYLALLKLGPLSAYEIAQKTGIYRPHVYDKIETLAKKGLVSYVQKGKKKIFSAAPPSKIMDYLKEQEKDVQEDIKLLADNLQHLSSLYSVSKEDTNVQVLIGVEGLKLRLKDTHETPHKENLIFGLNEEKYNKALPVFMPQYFKILKEKGIRERVITYKKKGVFMFDNEVTTYRFLDTKDMNPVNTIIYGNKVAFIIWGMPITTIIIENKQLAHTYSEHFEYLWKIADRKN